MIITKRTNDPTTCFVCQGVAMAVGVAKHSSKGYAVGPFNNWTCFHCIKTAKEIVNMKPGDVGKIETIAIEKVASNEAIIDTGIQTFIGALYDAGVRNLDDATGDQISFAKDALFVTAGAAVMVQSIVLAFGEEVRAAVERGDAPF